MNPLQRPLLNVLVLGLGLVVLLASWSGTVLHLFDLVWNVDTYSHGIWVPPVALWLIWRRRAEVMAAGPRFWWPGAFLLGGIQLVWLAGTFVEARVIEHVALVLSVQAVALMCLGLSAAKPIRFPLFFLFLIIPVGEQLVGPLQVITAKSVIWALDVSGIPFMADGVLIELSSGLYQVARACAGVKFLFSSVVMGVLLCHLAFTSWYRRAVMLAASVLVPILANAVRVYTTLLIAEWTDQSFAKDVDHIVYGWGFLSVVLLLLIIGAYRFSDKEDGPGGGGETDSVKANNEAGAAAAPQWLAAVAVFLPVASAAWAGQTAKVSNQCFVSEMMMPECEDCGFRLLPGTAGGRWFRPDRANNNQVWHYRMDATSIMGLTSLYQGQGTAHRMGRSFSYMLPPRWYELEGGAAPGSVPVLEGFAEKIIWQGERRRMLWESFTLNGRYYPSATQAKLMLALSRLKGETPVAQRLIVSTPYSGDPDEARRNIGTFLSTFGPDAFLWTPTVSRMGDEPCVA